MAGSPPATASRSRQIHGAADPSVPRETAVRGVYRLIVRHGRQVAAGLGLVLAATVVRAVLHALVGGAAAFLPFSVAVVLAAWYGRVAGITAAVASSITAAVWFVSAPAPA